MSLSARPPRRVDDAVLQARRDSEGSLERGRDGVGRRAEKKPRGSFRGDSRARPLPFFPLGSSLSGVRGLVPSGWPVPSLCSRACPPTTRSPRRSRMRRPRPMVNFCWSGLGTLLGKGFRSNEALGAPLHGGRGIAEAQGLDRVNVRPVRDARSLDSPRVVAGQTKNKNNN